MPRAWVDDAHDYHRRDQQDVDRELWHCRECGAITCSLMLPDDDTLYCDVCGTPHDDDRTPENENHPTGPRTIPNHLLR